jgi:hypothetical protein
MKRIIGLALFVATSVDSVVTALAGFPWPS